MASTPSFNNETSALNVATTYSSRASKKTILITGVSPNSLGEGIARSFAHGGASTIIITGRNNERLAEVTHALSTDYPSTNFRPLRFDLDSLASISSAATELLNDDDIPQIDILVASAGRHYFDAERILTSDGLEMHFAVNYLSTFHLVKSLLPKIKAAAKKNVRGATRIVTVTSGAIRASPIRFSDWNFDGNNLSEDEKPNTELVPFPVGVDDASINYDHRVAYGQSKTASVLLAVHLNTLFASEGIFSFSTNPGTVATRYAASLQDNLTDEQKAAVARLGTPKTVDQGAATAVVAALDPGLEPESGVYLTHCQVGEAPEWATSKEKAEKLWRLSENIIQKTLNMQG